MKLNKRNLVEFKYHINYILNISLVVVDWMISFSLVSLKKEETLLKKKQKYSHYLPEKLVVTKEHLSSTGEWLVELPESTSQTSTSVSASVKKNIEIIQHLYWTTLHSSEIRSFCLIKWPCEMFQNLTYFIYTKTQRCFFHFSFCATLFFSLMNALVYVT